MICYTVTAMHIDAHEVYYNWFHNNCAQSPLLMLPMVGGWRVFQCAVTAASNIV